MVGPRGISYGSTANGRTCLGYVLCCNISKIEGQGAFLRPEQAGNGIPHHGTSVGGISSDKPACFPAHFVRRGGEALGWLDSRVTTALQRLYSVELLVFAATAALCAQIHHY